MIRLARGGQSARSHQIPNARRRPITAIGRLKTRPDDLPLFRRTRRADTIEALYGAIVAQARVPVLRGHGVPDTVRAGST